MAAGGFWEAIDRGSARVCVLGLGRSGLGATRLLLRRGVRVRALELRPTDAQRAAWVPLAAAGAELIEGPHPEEALVGCDLLIRSPGVPADAPILATARRRGVPVRSELELAARGIATPILAITGTNGKTTTTAWAAHILRRAGLPAVAAGNIGRSLSDAVLEEPEGTIFVVEVSSFQLEDSPEFHPRAATILNITPDHLDRHGSLAAYSAAKWGIAARQEAGDLLVLGPGLAIPAGASAHARILRCEPEGADAPDVLCVEDGWIRRRGPAGEQRWIRVAELSLPGPHNLVNGMAAAGLATALVAEPTRLVHGLRDFGGLPHRLEEVGRIGGVRIINDSKSTNVDSLRVALQSYQEPIILIAGGRDKGGPFEELAELAAARVRRLVAIGEAAERIRSAWPAVASEKAPDLKVALDRALAAAGRSAVVLLSPGCASFDMFRNYEERGDVFRALARQHVEASARAGSGEAR